MPHSDFHPRPTQILQSNIPHTLLTFCNCANPGENVQKTLGPICFGRPATLWIFFAETASWQKIVWKSVCHTQHHPIQTILTNYYFFGGWTIDTCHYYQNIMLHAEIIAEINWTWVISASKSPFYGVFWWLEFMINNDVPLLIDVVPLNCWQSAFNWYSGFQSFRERGYGKDIDNGTPPTPSFQVYKLDRVLLTIWFCSPHPYLHSIIFCC